MRTVGYNASTSVVKVVKETLVMAPNSAEQPVERFVRTPDRVALLQAGSLHRLVSQVLMGATREVLSPAVTTLMKSGRARHWDAPGSARMVATVASH